MIHRRTAVALLASPLLLTGCGGGAEATGRRAPAARPAPTGTPTPHLQAGQAPQGIPGERADTDTGRQPGATWPAYNALRTLDPARHPVAVKGYADRPAA
ncbi:hypothetical protein ACFC8N_36580 [Streptomyces sp. NPDC055966]|uniref:hypothetical protein n=1 Tax=unclassified Streptomyces TaxID=2593676 RepID=UPI0035D5E921